MAHVSPCAVQRTARGPTARYGSGVHRENCGRGPTRSAGESIRAPLWIYGYASVTSPSGNPVPTNSLLWGMIRFPTKAAKESQDIVHRNGVFVCGPVTAPYSSLTSRPGCGDVRAVSATSFCGPSCLLRFRVPDGLGGRRERIGCSEPRVATSFWSVAPLRSQKHLQTSSIFTPTYSKSSSQRIQAVLAALIKP